MDLSLTHVINVALSLAQPGLSNFNVSNVAIFTDEQPSTPYTNGPSGTPALGFGIYYGSLAVGKDYGTGSKTYAMASKIFGQRPNILSGRGYLAVIPMAVDGTNALTETFTAAIARAQAMVQFFAILTNAPGLDAGDWTTAQTAIQGQNKILGRASYQKADLAANTGFLWQIMNSGDFRTRGMYYGNLGTQNDANNALAAAFGRLLSVDFSGSRTANTAALKVLATLPTDGSMDEATYTLCQAAGAMCYPSLEGVPALQDFNANGGFFDEIYNQSWFQGALQVAGFNALAQSSTKVPQTDDGADIVGGAYRRVCLQGVTNGYLAPGQWTGTDTFGNPADFDRNIQEQGFYIYAPPVAQQSPADRAARLAPSYQIAGKEAGAMHSSNVMVNINP